MVKRDAAADGPVAKAEAVGKVRDDLYEGTPQPTGRQVRSDTIRNPQCEFYQGGGLRAEATTLRKATSFSQPMLVISTTLAIP